MADKLLVYNAALLLCSSRALGSLSENREPRRLLDNVWDNGGVKTCLEASYWNFGTRTMRIDYDPGVAPAFGFKRGFAKPSDWCRTSVVSASEYLRPSLVDTQFSDEGGYWFSDFDELYVKFVSDLPEYGMDLSLWPESFTRYVEAYFAYRISFKITRDKELTKELENNQMKLKDGSAAKDAQDSGTSVPLEGSWNRARGGRRYSGRRDGGTRNSLYG